MSLMLRSGESVNVPIIIDSVNINSSVQRGIVAFNCTLSYNTTVFEIVGTDNEGTMEYFHPNESINAAINKCYFTKENNGLLVEFDVSRLGDGRTYIDSYTEVGYITLRASDDAKDGFYSLTVEGTQGGNDEKSIRVEGSTSYIHVDGIKERLATRPDYSENEAGMGRTMNIEQDELVVEFSQNDGGTKLFVYVNEQQGLKAGKATINGIELRKKDGYFEADVEPGKAYAVSFYDEDNIFIGIKWVAIEYKNGADNSQSNGSYSGQITTSQPSYENENDEKKSAGKVITGDNIYLWIGLVVILSANVAIIRIIKKGL